MKRSHSVGLGLKALIGKEVLLMCGNYFYHGTLISANSTVQLKNPSIVYETGPWDAESFTDAQWLPNELWYVQVSAIESFGEVRKSKTKL